MTCLKAGDKVYVSAIDHDGATVIDVRGDMVKVRWFDARDGGFLEGWFGLAGVSK